MNSPRGIPIVHEIDEQVGGLGGNLRLLRRPPLGVPLLLEGGLDRLAEVRLLLRSFGTVALSDVCACIFFFFEKEWIGMSTMDPICRVNRRGKKGR